MSTSGGSHDGVDIYASHQTKDDIEMSAQQHKRQRGYVKTNITQRSVYIRKLMTQRKNVDEVNTKLLVLEEAIQDFVSVQNLYHVQLSEMEAIQKSESQYDAVM